MSKKFAEALKAVQNSFKELQKLVVNSDEKDEEDEEEFERNEEEDEEKEVKPEDVTAMVKQALEGALPTAIQNAVAAALKDHKPQLSPTEAAAIAHAQKSFAEHKTALIAKIVANSEMKKEALSRSVPDPRTDPRWTHRWLERDVGW